MADVSPVSFALAPSMNIDTIVARRDATVVSIHALRDAYGLMHERAGAIFGDTVSTHPNTGTRFSRCADLGAEWSSHRHGRGLDDIDDAVKRLDASCWDRLLALSGLMQLMDAKQREEWRTQLDERKMPVFTRANINATFTQLAASRGEIFERGVINVFEKLSWDYKTNSPRKFGKRAIFTYACETHFWQRPQAENRQHERHGWMFYGPTHTFGDKLDDLLRVFFILDGKPEPASDQGSYALLGRGKWMDNRAADEDAPRDAELHGYVKFRGFKNKNAHLTFLRADLVDELNRIVAKHYPNALPPTDAPDTE